MFYVCWFAIWPALQREFEEQRTKHCILGNSGTDASWTAGDVALPNLGPAARQERPDVVPQSSNDMNAVQRSLNGWVWPSVKVGTSSLQNQICHFVHVLGLFQCGYNTSDAVGTAVELAKSDLLLGSSYKGSGDLVEAR